MKRFYILFIVGLSASITYSQTCDKSINLQEVQINGARVINKVDGKIIYPTDSQLNSSTTGYSILQKLSLPNIQVDEVMHSISAVDNRGAVQIRINGIESGKNEMQSLDPKTITKIDFINNPGVRYGEGVAYVINIITRRASSGYTIGTDLTQSLTAKNGDYMVYGKWNVGQNELALTYDFGYKDLKGNITRETAEYLLNDGTKNTIERFGQSSRARDLNNYFELKYNLADSSRYVFQAILSTNFNNTPGDYSNIAVNDGTKSYIASNVSNSIVSEPVLDLYYSYQFMKKQLLVLNAVGTYIDTESSESYNEGSPYSYNVNGKTYSFMGEAVYENKLKPFTLSSGINYKQKYTHNEYTGDAVSVNPMHNSTLYVFSDIKGVYKRIRYSAGIGVSYLRYTQRKHDYNYFLFKPKATFTYDFTNELQAGYDFQLGEHVSSIAMVSDAMIRNNSMEWTLGNPDIKPTKVWEHRVNLSYNKGRLQSFVEFYARLNTHPNMALYYRTDDNQFIYTQKNQKKINAYNVMGYMNYWVIPERLSLTIYGGMFRCLNFGDDYTHCYTAYFYQGSAQAYLGKFTLTASINNGWRFMEGESKNFNCPTNTISASYQYKNWQFSAYWQNPFEGNHKMYQTEIMNRSIYKSIDVFGREFGNMVTINISWKINKGRGYKNINRSINQKDTETGIIK